MSKYLITGGEGFIGTKITNEVAGISFDIKSGLDILNTEKLTSASIDVSGIFHCAAKISVPESIIMPDVYYKNNVEGTKSVTKVAETSKIKVIFSSSAAVYGESKKAADENSTLNPSSPYGQNKIDGEIILKDSLMPHIALRYFNVYGPGQSPQYAGVIASFINKALHGEDLVIHGDGNQIRDFIFVDDIVKANIVAMNYKNKSFDIFNIGSGIETSIKTLAETIIQITRSFSKIYYKPSRSGDISYSLANVSKAQKILGWSAKTPLKEGLEKTIEYYRNNKY